MQRGPVVAWLRLLRVSHRLGREMAEQLRAWDLSPAQFDILVQLGTSKGITQHELADHLKVTEGNICQLIGRLEKSGLLTRSPEGRINRLALTDQGHALLAEAIPAHEAWLSRRFSMLSHGELRQFITLLRRVDDAQEQA
jgi:MarR family 2-MHQ and catechol resistance regulon transcriptional repressor